LDWLDPEVAGAHEQHNQSCQAAKYWQPAQNVSVTKELELHCTPHFHRRFLSRTNPEDIRPPKGFFHHTLMIQGFEDCVNAQLPEKAAVGGEKVIWLAQ
jgi:hypothetical protein